MPATFLFLAVACTCLVVVLLLLWARMECLARRKTEALHELSMSVLNTLAYQHALLRDVHLSVRHSVQCAKDVIDELQRSPSTSSSDRSVVANSRRARRTMLRSSISSPALFTCCHY